jgi:hypothetical protein
MNPQYFKGDATELKVDAVVEETTETIDMQLDAFYDDAYQAAPLGDVIFDTGRSPLSNAIARDIFRSAFKEIFDAFVQVGTFDAYLTVFEKIFGEDVEIEFVVPAAGKLNISITAAGVELTEFIARYIQDNQYVYDEIIDDEGDNIVFQSIKGFTSQYELEQMLFEMVPAGIFTTISLTLG